MSHELTREWRSHELTCEGVTNWQVVYVDKVVEIIKEVPVNLVREVILYLIWLYLKLISN